MKSIRHCHMVLLGDLREYAVREVCQGAAEYVAKRKDLDLVPWPITMDQADLPSPADLQQADCLLVARPAMKLVFRQRRLARIPQVFFISNCTDPRKYSVEFDEEAIGRLAAEHLLVRGYRQLAFVGSTDMAWSRLRRQGFERSAKIGGVPCQHFEFPLAELPVYWSWNLTRRREQLNRLLGSLPKPCGILAANDVIACSLIENARLLGIAVPEQIAIVGVDDDPMPNAAASLAITSVRIPFRKAGQRAAELLDHLWRGLKVPRRIFLPPTLVVVRASTDVFMVADKLVRQAQVMVEGRRQGRVHVADLVKALRTNRVTLNKHFAQTLRITPSEYILRRRLEYAKELLRAGELNVEEVSRACGFSSCSYFCLIFGRLAGITPGKFDKFFAET